LILVAGVALGLRLWHIGDRPMHTDEAVHGVILGQMLETGTYRYNPVDSHGPTLYYLTWPLLRAMGVHDLAQMEAWQLRLVPALIGSAFILSLGLWARELGAVAVMSAALYAMLAAPFAYYQRYFIHEALFVFLSLLLIWTVWRFLVDGAFRYAVGMGLTAGCLFATKETAPLVVGALGVAGALTWITQTTRPSLLILKQRIKGALVVATLFGIVFVLFYTSFGTNPHGVPDAFRAIFRFAHRATGEGHEKPWWTYLAWIFALGFYSVPWSGWIMVILASVGVYARWNLPLVRLLGFYALVTLALYSLIPYKTPWLELNIVAPTTLLVGMGVSALYSSVGKRWRPFFYIVGGVFLLALGNETVRLCLENPVDARNPLAYSPTVGDIENLVQAVNAKSPDHDAYIQVVSDDYWPLPWYLRHEKRVGYWTSLPAPLSGDVIITSPDQLAEVRARLGPGWTVQFFGLRPEVLAVVLSRGAKK
jgi:uncharacterized protein (TIGR03663 family)